MRMLMNVSFPVHEFNRAVSDGTVGGKIETILEELKAETVYFTEQFGQRAALMIVNLENSSQIPAMAEPWFLHFNASVEFRIAMTPGELSEAGLESLGKKYAQPQ
ncbi:MAG: panthothenate synthetase [bacterium]|nr:panthothenate synthetase [bacterium]